MRQRPFAVATRGPVMYLPADCLTNTSLAQRRCETSRSATNPVRASAGLAHSDSGKLEAQRFVGNFPPSDSLIVIGIQRLG